MIMTSSHQTRIFFVAGEESGDLLASQLILQLKSFDPNLSFIGIGGEASRNAGAEIFYPYHEVSVVGITEVIAHVPKIFRIMREVKSYIIQNDISFVIFIDFPDFNLRLAQSLSRKGKTIIYYVSPQIWAWRKNRIKHIAQIVDKMLLLFPFEKKIYEDAGVPHDVVGHPIVDRLHPYYHLEYQPNDNYKTITLMPGSRISEIHHHFDELLKFVKIFPKKQYQIKFQVIKAPQIQIDLLEQAIKTADVPVDIITSNPYHAIVNSDLVLVASGTASLEVALLKKPMILFYRVSFLTFMIAKYFAHIQHIGLPNIISNEPIVTEYIQDNFFAENMLSEAVQLLENHERRNQLIEKLSLIRNKLGEPGASLRAARSAYNTITINRV